VFKIYIDGAHKILAFEKAPYGHFHAGDATLQLEHLDLIRQSFFVSLQHTNHILAVVFLADKQTPVTGEVLHVDGGAHAGRW